jgi:glycosyltransferase involved in cell wall biosynthesis
VSRSDAGPSCVGDSGRGTRPTVVHLDHTATEGGAEFALARMLSVGPKWDAVILLPPSEGSVFRSLETKTGGFRQPAGVSSGRKWIILSGAIRLIGQAVATRMHLALRRADVIDANTARAAAYGALAATASRVAFVVHLRDMVDPGALGGFGHLIMTRIALRRADGVIANSQTTLDSAAPYLRRDVLTRVIPSASGLTVGRKMAARHCGPLRIGMLARLDPWKGQLLLVDAFAEALGDTDATLEFAGAPLFGHEGYLEELRARTVERGLRQRVTFHGQVADVSGLLDTWDIAVQYSMRPEPLGQNVLQYLAASCAIVASREGGPAEWIDDRVNGLLVTPRDAAALAQALRDLAADASLRDRLARAAAATPGLLDDQAVMNAHARFYDELLARRPAHRGR